MRLVHLIDVIFHMLLVNLANLARQSLFSLRSTLECGWLLASATSPDRLSCDSHGALCTSWHNVRSLWGRPWQTLCRRSWTVCSMCHGSACRILSGSRSLDVPVPQILEEIVELVAGEVVCNARTGVRRQHGWTCTN